MQYFKQENNVDSFGNANEVSCEINKKNHYKWKPNLQALKTERTPYIVFDILLMCVRLLTQQLHFTFIEFCLKPNGRLQLKIKENIRTIINHEFRCVDEQ